MTLMVRLLRWILKTAIAAVGILFVMALGILLFVSFTPVGGRVAADRISELVSTPDRKITFSRPEGLLTGDLRVDDLVLSDDRGPYAKISGIKVDWSPAALVTGVFRADRISADKVNFIRSPEPIKAAAQQTKAASSSGTQLPVGIRVAQIDLPDINVARALSGRDFDLSLKGSIDATGPNISLKLEATRKDEADAKALADVLYAPSENRLTLKASVAEPQGGLLARLLLLPGAPAVNLSLDGEGPLSNWAGELAGSVNGTPVISVTGKHMLVANGAHRVEITGGGQLATLMPPAYRSLVDGTTDINIAATYSPSGRIDIQRGDLTSGAVKVSAKGAWDPTGDNSLTVGIAGTKGPVSIALPLNGQQSRASLESVNFTLTGAAASARFNATASLTSAELPQGRFNQIRLQAESEDLDLIQRAGTIKSRLTVGQLYFADPNLARAIRGPLTLDAPVRLAPPAIGLDAATFESAGASGTISGAYDTTKQTATGNFRLSANPAVLPPSIASKFDGMIAAEGYVESASVNGVSLQNLVLKSNAIEAHGNIALDKGKLSGRIAGRLPDIKRWLTGAEGAAGFDIAVDGPMNAANIKAVVNSAEARLVGRKLEDLSLTISGTANPSAPQGQLAASGSLDGQPIKINADVKSADGRTSAPAITAEIGPNKLNGSLNFSPAFVPTGRLNFDFPDVSLLAALAAQQAQGDLHGSVVFNDNDGKGSAVIKADGTALRRGSMEILVPHVDVTMPDIKALAAEGTIKAKRIGSGGNGLDDVAVGVSHTGAATAFDLSASFKNTPVAGKGALDMSSGMAVAIDSFSASPLNIPVQLANPTRIAIDNGTAKFSGLTLTTGTGKVTVDGSAGANLDVKATIASLPANLINAFLPAVNAAGVISGTISATGAASAPSVRYDLEWSDAQLRQTRDAGIAPFHLGAAGTFSGNTVTLEKTSLTGGGGLDISAAGRVTLPADKPPVLDINATAKAVPAALANAFAPQLGAKGTISGTVTATGTPEAPAVRYDLKWADAAVSQTATAGITTFDLGASGTVENGKVTLKLDLTGGGGIALSGGGTLGMTGDRPLAMKFDGKFPFSVLAGQLAAQGFTLNGNASVDLGINGPATAPLITGTVSTSAAKFVDVRHNLAINDLAANVSLDGKSATISNAGGTLAGGGTVNVQGTVGFAPGSGYPTDLRITLAKANYADGTLVAITADGALTVTGPLMSGPKLGGKLTLTKASITVPASLPSSLTAVNVRHRNAPADVLKQMDELRPKSAKGASTPMAVDIQIAAPNGIFVRGRGIDAELGGDLKVAGTATAPVVTGGFEMRRGRIVILTKRLDFSSGKITFGGGLIPVLDMEATTTSGQTAITVDVTGVANDPKITFGSSPALPQDEVLAQLIFGQSMSRLSPLQIAQLADAVTQLAGGGSGSLLESLRSKLGVDDLDVSTDSTGQTTVSVGRYINNKTYFQVEQGGQNGAQATINLDVGKGVKLKAGAGTTGGSAGIFYEHEY